MTGKPCTEPAVGAVLAFLRDGRVAARVRVGAGGRYQVRLAPGTYTVRQVPAPRIGFGLRPDRIRVGAAPTRADLFIDTGIRYLSAATGSRPISAGGVRVVAPSTWHRVPAAGDGNVVDPKTLLVVGTSGVRPHASRCQIGAYSIPPGGAAIVVVGWRTATSGGGRMAPGRAPLERLRLLRHASIECFGGWGAGVDVVLGGRMYQVNVMAGARAGSARIAEALAVARSFALSR